MITIIRKSLYKNGYLLIIAAWLFTISFIFSNYSRYSFAAGTAKKEIESFVVKGEQRFANFATDTGFVKNGLANTLSRKAYWAQSNEETGLFIYARNKESGYQLAYWNNNKMLPDAKDISRADGSYPATHANGYFEFVKKTIIIAGQDVVLCGMIPVYWNYGINNKYLQSKFPVDDFEKRYMIALSGADFYINNGEGKVLFGIQKKDTQKSSAGTLPLIFRVLALVFFLIWLNVVSLEIVLRRGWLKGFGFLAISLVLLRYMSYVWPFPFKFRDLSLFDSTIYASNFLHPTLGDLFINTILFYWLVSFIKFAATQWIKKLPAVTGSKGWLYTLGLAAVLIILTFTSAGIIRSLINDSQISFDVTNFFSLSIFSFLSFFILCFIILSFFHLSHILLLLMYRVSDQAVYVKFLALAVCAMAGLSVMLNSPATGSNLLVLVWLLVYVGIMEFRKGDIMMPVLQSSFFIIWIIFFAGSIAGLIIFQNRIVVDQKQVPQAEKLATEADKNAQNIFSTGIADIDNTFLTRNLNNFKNQTSNKALKDSLINRYLAINADAYDTRIYTFDENELPLYNDDSLSIYKLRTLVNGGHETGAPDVYYYEKDVSIFSFIYQKEILDTNGDVKGYFFIAGDPKKYKSQAVYPELFMPGNADEPDKNVVFAIYNKGKLVESNGDYNFQSYIPVTDYPVTYEERKKAKNQLEFWYNAGSGKLLITIRTEAFFIEFVTLFAYLFGSFLLIIVLFQGGRLLVRHKFRFKRMRKEVVFNIKYQIQTAILFISIFSFSVIGISTITFYINRFNQNNRERLIKSMKILTNEINSEVARQLFSNSGDDSGTQLLETFQKPIKDIAEIHGVDANLYDLAGRLQVTTQPEIYRKQILSSMMEPTAYFKLKQQQQIQVITEEVVSNFSFLSIYAPIYNQAGQVCGYLNIPYLNTQKELNQEISNFLVTLINLNAFIFLIAGAISVLVTNRITNSFSLIADKMKKINLGSANEEIFWSTGDEIGALVNEYNKMVKKLGDSAQALAKSEREGAWREMARQVAHEIKNPLTPMKLSIQYLQRAIQENSPNVVNLSKKVTATLVEQIDQLAKIASDFSQFANITKVNKEVFDLNELIGSLINLYNSNERLRISFNSPEKAIMINADRSQMQRLFTNLFQNAVEATPDNNPVIITITEELMNGSVQVNFADRGTGIPEEKRDRIFTPNFTTKSSGTGLGLAISKGIVENASGKIWFSTTRGEGTTFHILLPIA